MLPQIDSLPRTESAAATSNRDSDRRLRYYRPDMRRHVVRTFLRMQKLVSAFRYEGAHERFQIPTDVLIGIFAHHDRRTGVLDKNVAQPDTHAGSRHHSLHVARKIVGTAPVGMDFQILLNYQRSILRQIGNGARRSFGNSY